jgi:steroid delta-isomerase-like uncharacterized protein
MRGARVMRISAALLLTALAGCGAGARERNKAIAQRTFREVLSEGHFERAGELYAPDFVNHGLHRDASLAEDQAAARGWKQAFPDLSYSLEKMVAEGDTVAVLWVGRGTNSGEGNGLPATGRKGAVRGITLWRIVDGKIHDEWTEFDSAQIALQLGLGPATK